MFDIKNYILYYMSKKGVEVVKNKKLKLARVEKDMTQKDLADAIGVSRQTIGLIEAGNFNPSLALCISICKALNKTLDELFWEDENNENKTNL